MVALVDCCRFIIYNIDQLSSVVCGDGATPDPLLVLEEACIDGWLAYTRTILMSSSANLNGNNAVVPLSFAPPGDDGYLPLQNNNSNSNSNNELIWHGSSLALLAAADAVLRQEFNMAHVERDFAKWHQLGARPYYLTAIQQSSSASPTVMSCLRCVLDGAWSDSSNNNHSDNSDYCTRRLVIDYLVTRAEFRNRGLAGQLLQLVRQAAAMQLANMYVVAHQDAAVYWMEQGFVLVNEEHAENAAMHGRFGGWDDSFLLQLPSNRTEDPTLPIPSSSSSSSTGSDNENDDDEAANDGDDASSSSSSGSSSGGDNNDDDDDDDDDDERNLQRAIMESLNME